jgi:capsular polysaccharide biosynthesis protein
VALAASKALLPDVRVSANHLQKSVKVNTPTNSLILTISATAGSARHATAEADAIAEAYLSARRELAQDKVDRLVAETNDQLAAVTKATEKPGATAASKRPLNVRADALASNLARLGTFDVDPGRVVSKAEKPGSASTPGLLLLALSGLFLGVLLGVPFALLRKEDDSEIGSIDRLSVVSGQIVLDGTRDAHRSDTWDIAAFMLKLPEEISAEHPFTIMVDADDNDSTVAPGEELVDALARRGRRAHFVDASAINEGKIRRGWPTERKLSSWAGEIIVIDTTLISSAANKVAIASRSDSVLLVRTTTDDAASLRRFVGLLTSKGVDITLSCLFPSRTRSGGGERVTAVPRHASASTYSASIATGRAYDRSRGTTLVDELLEPQADSQDPTDD